MKRGARLFATNGVAPDPRRASITHCGFVNPDGTHVLVVANRGSEQRAQFVLDGSAIELDLPADSVHTLEWS